MPIEKTVSYLIVCMEETYRHLDQNELPAYDPEFPFCTMSYREYQEIYWFLKYEEYKLQENLEEFFDPQMK